MSNKKLLAGVLLVLAVLFAQVGTAAAASPLQTTTPITGTVQSVSTETDANGVVTTAVVTLLLPDQTTQTVRIPAAYATELGLLDETTQQPVPIGNVPLEVSIDPAQVIPEEEPTEESVHPIAWLLAEFFSEDPAVIEGYHEDGFGFGVIAQSLWISKNVSGDASLAEQILQAKQSGDYSNIMLSDGTALTLPDGTVPTNWGQFKKALSEKKNNLGFIVSGHADQDNSNDLLQPQQHGNGQDKDNKENKGKGKDKNKNHP
jgi:hypothetical protein